MKSTKHREMSLSWKINNSETQEKGTLGVKIQKIPNEACPWTPV